MAIKYCWATNRRGSSLKGVMKLKEIGHDQSPVGVCDKSLRDWPAHDHKAQMKARNGRSKTLWRLR